MTHEEIVAVQFAGPLQSSVAISPRKIYRVRQLSPWEGQRDIQRKWFRNETDRVRVLELVDDDGAPTRLGVDLDDPDVTFFYPWHLDQFAGLDSSAADR